MGVVLPGWADEILDLIGISWPNVDEDDYREMATAMREFSSDIQDGASQAHDSIQSLVSSAGGGKAADALNAHWSKVNGTHLTKLAHCGELAATALDGVALLIEGAKLGAIVQLGILAAEVIAAQAAAPFTFGLSELGALGATQATRVIVKRLFKEVCQQVTEHVVSIALTPVEEALTAMVSDLVIQLGANALGVQKGVDVGHAVGAGKDGFKQGVQGAKEAAGGMQLLSAGGGSGSGGGGGAGSGFTFDPGAHDDAVSGLQSAGSTFRHKAGGKIGKAKGHHARTKGKDAIADAANGMLHKVIDGLEDGLKKTAKHLDDDMSRGVKQMKKNHHENDAGIATEIQSLGKNNKGPGGPAPAYFVDDKGKVTRLTDQGHQDLTDEDRSRLAPIGLQEDSVPKRQASKYPLPDKADRKKKPSQQVGFGSTDLSRATRSARDAESDYGRTNKDKFTSRNYAAARYGERGADDEFILVGRSKWPGAHSERQIGIPFLDAGTTHGMRELYTEREPCTSGKGSVDCSAWMSKYLPDGVQVSHSVEYGETEESKKRGNDQMKQYLDGIRPKKK